MNIHIHIKKQMYTEAGHETQAKILIVGLGARLRLASIQKANRNEEPPVHEGL